jgi:hypothetical protein
MVAWNSTFVAVVADDRHAVRVFDTRMLPQIGLVETKEFPQRIAFLTLDPGGRIATLNSSGAMIAGEVLPETGKPTLLEFFEDHGILISNESGLLLLSNRFGLLQVPNVPPNIAAVAIGESKLAFASADSVVVLTHQITPPIDDAGLWILGRWLGVTVIVGLLCLVRAVFVRAEDLRERRHGDRLARISGPN